MNISEIKKHYTKGKKIRLISMDDVQAPPPGTVGEVVCVDDAGQIHVKWQTGSSLAVIPGVDSFAEVKDEVQEDKTGIAAEIRRMEQAVAKTKSPYLKRDYEKAIARLKKQYRKSKGEVNV